MLGKTKQHPQMFKDKPKIVAGRYKRGDRPYFIQAAGENFVETIMFSKSDIPHLLKGWGLVKKGD